MTAGKQHALKRFALKLRTSFSVFLFERLPSTTVNMAEHDEHGDHTPFRIFPVPLLENIILRCTCRYFILFAKHTHCHTRSVHYFQLSARNFIATSFCSTNARVEIQLFDLSRFSTHVIFDLLHFTVVFELSSVLDPPRAKISFNLFSLLLTLCLSSI